MKKCSCVISTDPVVMKGKESGFILAAFGLSLAHSGCKKCRKAGAELLKEAAKAMKHPGPKELLLQEVEEE
ncbi:hypothetical protein GTO27_02485 [Candidatus Bathyarchaeota archaeon]|nr:hypothetical protein [Candidatus Bathyarchaeota archaeon]